MPKLKEIAQPAAALASDVPGWVTETPMETEYNLTMYGDDGGSVTDQNILLTRAEFIALKAHLAAMRGYKTEAAQ